MSPREPQKTNQGIICPKCGNAQNDARACHRCGLMFSKFDSRLLSAEPPAIVELWEKVLTRPADSQLHESFQKACLDAGLADVALRKYRLLSLQPEQQSVAEEQLQRLATLGQKLALIHYHPPAESSTAKPLARYFLLLVFSAIAAAVGWIAYLALRNT